jgi:hypothetical protein
MHYHYTRAFFVKGALAQGSQEIVLLDEPSEGLKFTLSGAPDPFLVDADRSQARGLLTAANITVAGGPPQPPLKPFGVVVEEIRTQREKLREGRMVLICQFEGTAKPLKLYTATRDGFTSAFIHHDDADKMIAKHQSQIDRALASLFAADTLIVRFEELAESLTLTTEEGLDVVTNTTRLGISSVRRTFIDSQKEAKLHAGFKRCFRSDKDLSRVTRLLSDSVLATKDRLKSFLAAWASLEIFVNKFCSKQPAIPSQAQKEPVLVFRFNSAAKNLGVNDPDKKEAIFKKVKKSRDDLLHGKEVDERLFPIEETQALVRAFLENIS